MVSELPFEAALAAEPPAVARILRTAAHLLFTYGYPAFTMDALAHELGVSKKTLYVHFDGKDAIVGRLIELIGATIRTRMDAALSDPALKFTDKAAALGRVASETIGRMSPGLLRELQRFAPAIYQKIEDLRSKTIPVIFGRLLRAGIAEGKVRPDIDPDFATEFWLHAIRGLVQPAALERTHLTLPQTMEKALALFFAGVLTPSGRKDHEKHR